MINRLLPLLCALALLAAGGLHAADEDEALRVIILANRADPDSIELAHFYALRRGVPEDNIIALPLSADETITRAEFQATLFQPLQDELVKRRWIAGFDSGTTAGPGRKKYLMLGHKISYLVVCRGVPLRVEADPTLPVDWRGPLLDPALKTNAAAVDSELALLPQSGFPLTGFVRNPLYRNDAPISIAEGQVVRVSRLDGPTAADARRLVDEAIAVERTGLIGRGYIDLGGPHPQGDQWLTATGKELAALGFDTDTDHAPATMPLPARFDAPVLYFGWYAGDMTGPFKREGFRFPPGAIALHIYSFSATSLRNANAGWTAQLIARGVTATFGNVYEPYLEFTQQPHLLLQALARGWTLGEAAAYSQEVFSWMTMVVGDPLYRPFKVTLEEQERNLAKLPAGLRTYVMMRRIRLLAAAGKTAEAVAAGREAQATGFSLPLALTLADIQRTAGDGAGAKASLAGILALSVFKPDEAPLAAAAAAQYEAMGDATSALRLWQKLLSSGGYSIEERLAWLRAGLATARVAKDGGQASQWEADVQKLDPAVVKK